MQFCGSSADLVVRTAPWRGQLPGIPQEGPWSCIALGPRPTERRPVPGVLPAGPGTWSKSLHQALFFSSFVKLKGKIG